MDIQKYKIAIWRDDFLIGIPELDAQHKILFDYVNDLYTSIIVHNQHLMNEVLLKLETYSISHFMAEEVVMRISEYPVFEQHRTEHQTFIQKLIEVKMGVIAGKSIELDLLKFLTNWLYTHINNSDKELAKFVLRKNDQPVITQPSNWMTRWLRKMF